MSAFAESLADFFSDFAVTATLAGGATITGIFDRAHQGLLGIDATAPNFKAADADIAARSIVAGTSFVIAGTTWYVHRLLPDGTGVTDLVLSLEPL